MGCCCFFVFCGMITLTSFENEKDFNGLIV